MEPIAMLQADPLDLLFENRNKSYGAYTLRKYYPQRLMIAMGITFSLVVLTVVCYLFFHTSPVMTREYFIPETNIEPLVYPVKEKPSLPPARPFVSKPPAAIQYATPLIVADRDLPESMPTLENLHAAVIGSQTIEGANDNAEMQNNGEGKSQKAGQVVEPVENSPEVLDRAEIMPEFPGGTEALKRFLLKNLRMPENNLDPGTEVHVTARFVVGADGKVRDIEIVQAAETVFNAEVKRVISKMPDWKPGSQNHRNVAVYYNLPVSFVNGE